jgi:RHS repeat-associated protein
VPAEIAVPSPLLRVCYYHQDHLGSAACISDAQGQRLRQTAYYPYGAERHVAADEEIDFHYGFTQKERDPEHGMLNFESRFLSPVIGRFIRVDSLADKFKLARLHMPQSLDPYSYCHNNPLALTDPDGREARVTMHGDNTITITVAIQYTGPLANKANIARSNKSIEKYWSGKFGRYTVKTKVVESDPTLTPAVVTLTDKDEKGKTLRSYVNIDKDTGRWDPKDPDYKWVAAHEGGHLLGLDDRYSDNKWGGSTPHKGWRGNMMAETWGKVEERNITELLQTPDEVRAKEGRTINRKVVDRRPETLQANHAALEADMQNQMNAWKANP